MAYTPGVARVCKAIAADESSGRRVHDPQEHCRYRFRRHSGARSRRHRPEGCDAGDGGQGAALQGVRRSRRLPDLPRRVDSPEEIIETVIRLAPTFGGVNLEDIAAPGAFQVEEALKEALDIPVFHDDQHGTAVVTLAAVENALRITGKKMADLSIVISGVGAAGVAIGKILLGAGATKIVGVDSKGAVYDGRDGLNSWKQWFAENTNPESKQGDSERRDARSRRVHRRERP